MPPVQVSIMRSMEPLLFLLLIFLCPKYGYVSFAQNCGFVFHKCLFFSPCVKQNGTCKRNYEGKHEEPTSLHCYLLTSLEIRGVHMSEISKLVWPL
jgi:hypothetical protein